MGAFVVREVQDGRQGQMSERQSKYRNPRACAEG